MSLDISLGSLGRRVAEESLHLRDACISLRHPGSTGRAEAMEVDRPADSPSDIPPSTREVRESRGLQPVIGRTRKQQPVATSDVRPQVIGQHRVREQLASTTDGRGYTVGYSKPRFFCPY